MIQSKQCFKKTSLRDKLEYIHEGVGLEIYQMFTRWVVGLQVCFVLSFPRIFLVIFWTVDSLTVSVPKIKKKIKTVLLKQCISCFVLKIPPCTQCVNISPFPAGSSFELLSQHIPAP